MLQIQTLQNRFFFLIFELFLSYRRLALKFHPKLTKEEKNTAYHHFCEISEAYEVLIDRKKKITNFLSLFNSQYIYIYIFFFFF